MTEYSLLRCWHIWLIVYQTRCIIPTSGPGKLPMVSDYVMSSLHSPWWTSDQDQEVAKGIRLYHVIIDFWPGNCLRYPIRDRPFDFPFVGGWGGEGGGGGRGQGYTVFTLSVRMYVRYVLVLAWVSNKHCLLAPSGHTTLKWRRIRKLP